MNPDLEKLFDQAVSLAGTEREEFIARHCPDPELRRELEMLLASDQGAGTFLQGAVMDAASSVLQDLAFSPGQRIGRYRVLSMIGHGGMGLVYLAERADGKLEQRVALKVLKSGPGQPFVAEHLQRECHILASLEHPNIARVLDADITENGQPYFVMEYVDGQPIDRYCNDRKLSVRERLRVLLPVCDAVHLAHQKLIVHRDLKPDNILVTASGIPKLLDFGIAKVLTEVPVNPQTTATRVLTPEYASPEQARGEPVTTATDVYSLGGVLYKLLTGSTPHQLENKSPLEAVRAICEQDVSKPSALRHELGGDVDSILLKALQTDTKRRYRSVDQFAADLQRWLEGKPVAAVPPSPAYLARKFAHRHRVVLAIASAFALVLVVAAMVSIRQGIRANQEAAVAEAVNEFLQNDLLAQASASSQSGPNTKPDPDLKVRTALDRAAQRIEGKFAKQPDVEASIRDTVGWTYLDLGLYPEARKQLERALELRQRVLGTGDAKTLKSMTRLGSVAAWQGKYPEAEALVSRALAGQRRVLGAEHSDTLASMDNLALVYRREGKYPQAEALHSKTLEIRRRVLGAEHPDTLATMSNLAMLYSEEGKNAEAEALHSQTLEIERRVLGPEHPATLVSMNNLANVYYSQGKYGQAEALHSQTLGIRRRVLGAEHPDTLGSMNNLALVYSQQGKYGQAEALYSQTLEIKRRVLGPEHPSTLNTLSDFAQMYQLQGRYGLAETQGVQTLAGYRHAFGSEHPYTMEAATDLALAYQSQRKFAETEALAREVLAFNHKMQPEDWHRFCAESLLGASLSGQKRYTDAEPLLLEGYQGMLARRDRIPVENYHYLDRSHKWLVELYEAWGKPEKAAEWRDLTRSAGGCGK
jgi:tetratricopeptide (TPR) repeat protein